MRTPRLLSSGAFRFAMMLALVFGIGSAALLAVVERSVDGYAADTLEDRVVSEIDILRGEDAELGRVGLVRAVERHGRAMREHDFRYLLLDPRGARLAGALPQTVARPGIWRLHLAEPDDATGDLRSTPMLVEGVRLTDGSLLVVAVDATDLGDLRHRLIVFTAAFGLAIALLVMIGGSLIGSVFLRRLDRVNGAIGRIVSGRFAERLPPIGMGPEFDQLSVNLNAMLDRIETLMDGLRQVSTDVAHDLRTPLARLRQRLEAIQTDAHGDDVGGQIADALRQTDEILSIFAALLRIGALENGAARAMFGQVDLSELVSRVGAVYRPEIEDGGRLLVIDIQPGVVVFGDADLCAQALANLLDNAVAHTDPGTQIRLVLISAERPGSTKEVRLLVEDDGPGIPVAELARVLRRFYRLDRSRSTPGVGLGLPLVTAIAELHGGGLVIEGTDPGLRAIITIPLLRLESLHVGQIGNPQRTITRAGKPGTGTTQTSPRRIVP